MTRLRLDTADGRVVVGYDPDLATYYLETGQPMALAAAENDPDEGLVTVRGRVDSDLPDLDALRSVLESYRIALAPSDAAALADACQEAQRMPSSSASLSPGMRASSRGRAR